MNIWLRDGKFVVWRGDENRPSYFGFFVDGDKSSWTRYASGAAHFQTKEAALEAIEKLRARAKSRRQARQVV